MNATTTHSCIITVDGIGKVFSTYDIGVAVENLRGRSFGANFFYNKRLVAFINHDGKVTPTSDAPGFIRVRL